MSTAQNPLSSAFHAEINRDGSSNKERFPDRTLLRQLTCLHTKLGRTSRYRIHPTTFRLVRPAKGAIEIPIICRWCGIHSVVHVTSRRRTWLYRLHSFGGMVVFTWLTIFLVQYTGFNYLSALCAALASVFLIFLVLFDGIWADSFFAKPENRRHRVSRVFGAKHRRKVSSPGLNPNDADACYNYGDILRNQDKLEEALVAYERALQLDPNDPYACLGKGNVLQSQGKLEEALVVYEQAIRLGPNVADNYNDQGIAFQKLGKWWQALAAYERAVQLNPDFALAYYNQGNVLQELGKPLEALTAYEHAIQLNPNDADIYVGKGNVLQSQGELERALVAYKQALQLDPNNADAGTGKRTALQKLGKPLEGSREAE